MSCPNCDKLKNGVKLAIGLHIFTASKSACCPIRAVITYFDSRVVTYLDKNNLSHSKPIEEFIKSSWEDRFFNI